MQEIKRQEADSSTGALPSDDSGDESTNPAITSGSQTTAGTTEAAASGPLPEETGGLSASTIISPSGPTNIESVASSETTVPAPITSSIPTTTVAVSSVQATTGTEPIETGSTFQTLTGQEGLSVTTSQITSPATDPVSTTVASNTDTDILSPTTVTPVSQTTTENGASSTSSIVGVATGISNSISVRQESTEDSFDPGTTANVDPTTPTTTEATTTPFFGPKSQPDQATTDDSSPTDGITATGSSETDQQPSEATSSSIPVVDPSVDTTATTTAPTDSSESVSTPSSTLDSSTPSSTSLISITSTSTSSSDTQLITTTSSDTTPSDTPTDTASTSTSSTSSSSDSTSTSLTTIFSQIITTQNGQLTTISTPVATLNTAPSQASSSNRSAIIAGSTVGGILLIILCLALIFVCRRRQKKSEENSHRYLPTPRSVMLSGEDDFDLAGPSTRRGLGFFGSLKRNRNDIEEYRDGSRDPQGPTNVGGENPEMRQIDEPPPRILRPVASKTGSYFQEAVWPPPEEGSRIVDPLMVASSVDLTSIVDEVMGPNPRSAGSIPRSSGSFDAGPSAWTSRLRGGAEGFNESGFDLGAAELHSAGVPVPWHTESPTGSSVGGSPNHERDGSTHQRDGSISSETALLSSMDTSVRGGRRFSGNSWTSQASAGSTFHFNSPPVPVVRTVTQPSPLRVVTDPQAIGTISASASFSSGAIAAMSKKGKEKEVAQDRRSSLVLTNPDNGEQSSPVSTGRTKSSILTPSFSLSTSSTHHQRGTASDMHHTNDYEHGLGSTSGVYSRTHLPPRDNDIPPVPVRPPPDEIPPRYDMIRRDTASSEAAIREENISPDTETSPRNRPLSTQSIGKAL